MTGIRHHDGGNGSCGKHKMFFVFFGIAEKARARGEEVKWCRCCERKGANA
jgi:hypothetical protein